MTREFVSAAAIPAGFWRWPHVSPDREWADRRTGNLVVVEEFMDKIEKLRRMYGHPLLITSGYRSAASNMLVSTTGADGPHTTGRAVDIAVYGDRALALISLAIATGFTGLGLKQHGPHGARFIHLDDLPAAGDRPRPYVWTYS